MNEGIMYELTTSLPASIDITEGKGRRFAVKVTDHNKQEFIYNIYHPENLYMHVDDSVLCVIIAKEQQEPSKIKARLKALIKGRPITASQTIEGEPYIGM